MFGPSFQTTETIIDGVFRQLPKWYFHWSFQYDSVNLNSLSSKNSCDFPRVISFIFSQGSRPYICKGKCIIAVKRNVFTIYPWN